MLYLNGKLFDGRDALPPGHALLVEEGRVRAIAPAAQFEGHAGPRFDLRGDTLLPGLIDCHVHLTMSGDGKAVTGQGSGHAALTLQALENAQASLRGGVTALRDCGGVDHVEFAVRDACNSGRFLGPHIKVSGKVICMTGGTKWKIARVADGPDEVVKAVREQIYMGCDCIKLMATGAVLHPGTDIEDAQYTEEELTAGVNEARRFRKPTAAHAIGTQGILNAARAGVTSIEHGMFMTDETVRLMLERGIFLVPTLAAIEHVLLNPDAVSPVSLAKAQRVAQRHRESVGMYYRAGGRIAMGADTGTLCNPHGENAQELRYMVACGMSPRDALAGATSVAADLLRLPDRGTLKEGQIADLLIVSGDPLSDIERVADRRNHRLVIKDGRVVGGPESELPA
ncbi:MAG: amidohydrolase family protein [Burkholderiales bacterium]|nr:amidohydrolase family protein [Burkholderiales bacterium]